MTRIGTGTGHKIQNLQSREIQAEPKVAKQQQAKTDKATLKDVGTQGIDGDKAKDFVAGQSGPRDGSNALSVQLAALKNPTLDDIIETVPYSAIYVAKDIMSSADVTSFLKGEMSPKDFKAFLEQANTPLEAMHLQALFGDYKDVVASMSPEQKASLDAGQMSPIDFSAVRDGAYERLSAMEDLPQRPAALDQATQLYKSSDIKTRVKTGKGANVMFGGQLMDRAVLGGMIDAMAGKGDGRVSRADVDKLLPKILDGNKITTPEENAMLFGMKYLRFTPAADRALAKGVGDAYPDSALARFGGLSQPPRFKDYEQYDLPMFANRSADLYGAKAVMSEAEMATWSSGEMPLAQFNDVLKRACKPMAADDLTQVFGEYTVNSAFEAMTDDEQRRFEKGRMSPAELQNIEYRAWENESPSTKGRTPYQPDYKAGFKPFVVDDVSDKKVSHLARQLDQLNALLDKGDIDGMLALFPKDIVDAQLELGASKEQFLLEALGLGMADGPDVKLSEIEHLSIDTSRVEVAGPGAFNAFGLAILKNGDNAAANLLLDPDYNLSSAVG